VKKLNLTKLVIIGKKKNGDNKNVVFVFCWWFYFCCWRLFPRTSFNLM